MTVNGILLGLLASLVFALVVYKIQKVIDKNNIKNREADNKLEAYASSEAINVTDELTSEFHSLISEIAWHKAGIAGKLLTHQEADGVDCPGEKLISPEDMEAAFLEAAKLVSSKCASPACPCKTNCDKQSLFQKIRNIRKNFEKKSQTP